MADSEKVRKLFEEYDFNKNGVLEKEEFLTIFKKMLHEIGQYIPDNRHEEVNAFILIKIFIISNL